MVLLYCAGAWVSRHAEMAVYYFHMPVSLLKLIFWGFILFLALSFFGISIQAIVNSPAGQANLDYLTTLFSHIWLWTTQWIRPNY